MFSLATGIYQSYFAPPKLSIIILGLDGSGKTALLERIKVTEITNDATTATSTTTSYLPSMYTKGGAAVAGVDDGDDGYCETMNGTQQQPQQRRPTKHHGAGSRPARLPPPLPPKQAMESHRLVDKMIKEGFYNDDVVVEAPASASVNGNIMDATTRLALERICPPPLVPISAKETKNHSSSSSENASDNNQKMKLVNKSVKSTLPPLPSSSSISTSSSSTAQQLHANPKSTFIGLLRCPSPIKYSNAVIVDDYNDEEELLDEEPIDDPPDWDTEYLRDYYINYQEEEEFDIKQTRVGSGSSSTTGGGGGNKSGSQAKKMFPLDRIRPTLGQNLATLDLRGCKCSLFDLSGAVSSFVSGQCCISSHCGIRLSAAIFGHIAVLISQFCYCTHKRKLIHRKK